MQEEKQPRIKLTVAAKLIINYYVNSINWTHSYYNNKIAPKTWNTLKKTQEAGVSEFPCWILMITTLFHASLMNTLYFQIPKHFISSEKLKLTV